MNIEKKVVCIIQARTGSTRLPNKIFLDLAGKPVLERVIDRVRAAETVNQVVIACPDSEQNNIIEEFVDGLEGIGLFRGSEDDVLGRYYQAAKKYSADVVIRITSDCPLMDPEVIDKVVKVFLDNQSDYVANILGERTYPRGLDIEVFSFATLEKMAQIATEAEDREHVTLYLRKHPEEFSTANVTHHTDYSAYRLTLDEKDDYTLISKIYERMPANDYSFEHVVALLEREPELAEINKTVIQKYGAY